MNRQSEIRLAVRGAERDHGSVWPSIIGRLMLLCAAAALALLLIAESRLSSGQRLELLQSTSSYP
jgi:hypothetical protein